MFSESLIEATRAAIQVQQGAEAELLPALSLGWLLKDAVGSFSQLGRWTAKRAPATVLGLPQVHTSLMNIEILAGSSSAAEAYVGHQPASVSISLSHRDGVAACAIAHRRLRRAVTWS